MNSLDTILKMPLLERAELWSTNQHRITNHKYGEHPYEYHLKSVVEVAKDYINLLPENKRDIVIAMCWAHDTIEDTRANYNLVKKVLGYEVAEGVFALSEEKGRNRNERASRKYYDGIARSMTATFVKLCDRIANMNESYTTKNSMFEKYKSGLPYFIKQLDVYPQLQPMIERLKLYML